MKNSILCPICAMGNLTHKQENEELCYKSKKKIIPLSYYICSHCGIEQSGRHELRDNKRAMNKFKKEVDGLLTGDEVKGIRENLGISQAEASKVFGGGPVAFSKYESDDVIQSEAMDKLIRISNKHESVFVELCRAAGLNKHKPLIETTIRTSGLVDQLVKGEWISVVKKTVFSS